MVGSLNKKTPTSFATIATNVLRHQKWHANFLSEVVQAFIFVSRSYGFVVGNFKMNGTLKSLVQIVNLLNQSELDPNVGMSIYINA